MKNDHFIQPFFPSDRNRLMPNIDPPDIAANETNLKFEEINT